MWTTGTGTAMAQIGRSSKRFAPAVAGGAPRDEQRRVLGLLHGLGAG